MTMPSFPILSRAHTALSEDAIIAALRAGDASGVSPFMERYYGPAVNIVSRYVSPGNASAAAWDALSDLALELLEGRHRHARLQCPQSYVAQAVKHHVLAALRRERRREKRHDALGELEINGVYDGPVSQATRRAAHGGPFEIDDDAFPPAPVPPLAPDALALMTWVGDGWTQQQIADELHIEREACKKRIARTKRRLRQCVA